MGDYSGSVSAHASGCEASRAPPAPPREGCDAPRSSPPSLPPTSVRQTDFSPGRGNALQACIASLLGLQLADVPNFVAIECGYMAAIAGFAASRELVPRRVELSIADAARQLRLQDAGRLCVLRGKSPRGAHAHVVVARVEPPFAAESSAAAEAAEEAAADACAATVVLAETAAADTRHQRQLEEDHHHNQQQQRQQERRQEQEHQHDLWERASRGFAMVHDPHPDDAFLDPSEPFGWCMLFDHAGGRRATAYAVT